MKKIIIFIFFIVICTACTKPSLEELPTPENLRIENNKLYWDKVKNASIYIIDINGEKFTTSETQYDLRHLLIGYYNIKVKARKDGYIDSDYTETITYSVNDSPKFLTINNDQLTWMSVKNAKKYRLYINEEIYEVKLNSFDLSKLKINNVYEIRVTTLFEEHESELSQPIYFAYYQKPENLEIIDKVLTWDESVSCDKYTIYINGDTIEVLENNYDLSHLPENMYFTIKIKAHYGDYQSNFSRVIEYNTYHEQFAAVFDKDINNDDLVISLNVESEILQLIDENGNQVNDGAYLITDDTLVIKYSYLNELTYGNHFYTLITKDYEISLKLIVTAKPHIISDNILEYTGEDIELLFEFCGGEIKLSSVGITQDDYYIEANRLVLKKDFIDSIFAYKDQIIMQYVIQNYSNLVYGLIFINK